MASFPFGLCEMPSYWRAQVDKTLAAEQKRADFQPRGDSALALDLPTDACVLVTALLRAVVEIAADTLHPGNLAPCLAEARLRLPAHVTSFGLEHTLAEVFLPILVINLQLVVDECKACSDSQRNIRLGSQHYSAQQ